jgi:predicted transposase YbfD/YdcC
MDDKCSICYDNLDIQPKYTLPCQHTFHTDCIIKSLRQSNECPYCRDTDGITNKSSTNDSDNVLDIAGPMLFSDFNYKLDKEYDDYSEYLDDNSKEFKKDFVSLKKHANMCKKQFYAVDKKHKTECAKIIMNHMNTIEKSSEFVEMSNNVKTLNKMIGNIKRKIYKKLKDDGLSIDSDIRNFTEVYLDKKIGGPSDFELSKFSPSYNSPMYEFYF